MSQKYGLDEIKTMLKLVHARVSKDHIKLVLQLAEGGINKDNVDDLYDILASDLKPLHVHTPPNSLPRSDTTVADFESPPSSQGYPSTISDNETTSRPLEIDSPPYTDEDPWAGLPKDPNYTPRTNNSKQSHVTHDSSVCSTPSNNHHQNTTTNTAEKRTRDRFVFRTIHQEILNTAFFQNPYPENDEKEILVDQCNHALEGYKCRPLRENEKMTILNITNWFNNRRKEKKRKCYQEPAPLAIVPPPSSHSSQDSSRVKEEVISEQEDEF